MTTYAFVNQSKAAELAPVAVLGQMVSDIQEAYDLVFAPALGTLTVTVEVGPAKESTDRVLVLKDMLPEAPGALAYHSVDDKGRPVLFLGVETIRSDGNFSGQALLDQISIAASHEIFETAADPFCVLYCFVDGKNVMLSYEVCDPVQGGSFKQGKTAISNFVLTDYWDAGAQGPYDYCHQLSTPLSCDAAGYQAWSDGTQTFGSKMSEMKKHTVKNYGRKTMQKAA
jgi:hypothetical protein